MYVLIQLILELGYGKYANYCYSFTNLKPNNHLKRTIFSAHKELSDSQSFLTTSLLLALIRSNKGSNINGNFSSTTSELSKHRNT